jgi:phosphodiesterase/alkaline phosphatase D-like protein
MMKPYVFALVLATGFSSTLYLEKQALSQVLESTWPDPVANDLLPYRQYTGPAITHGPVLGRPGPTSMRVWVRTSEPMWFKVIYATRLPLRPDVRGVEGKTLAENDNTGWVDITGLEPGTMYYYGIVIERRNERNVVDTRTDSGGRWPTFKTLPSGQAYVHPEHNPNGLFNICFAAGFGNRISEDKYATDLPGFGNLLRNHGRDVMFYLNNGDNIYEVHRTRANRPHDDFDLFRSDYKHYLTQATHLAAFYRCVPQLFTYDDHEVYSDLEGTGEIGLGKGKWLYRDIGLKPWYEYQAWANFHGSQYRPIIRGSATVAQGSDVLHDPDADFRRLSRENVSNIHVMARHKNAGIYGLVEAIDQHHVRVTPAFKVEEQFQYSVGTHHYFDFTVGNCHFFVLDARGERARYDPEKIRDPAQFILGASQMTWLKKRLAETNADFIFIASSVPWMVFHTDFHVTHSQGKPPRISPTTKRSYKEDGFTGALVEREELLQLFDGLRQQVLLLTGDLHCSFAIRITDNVWEFMMGPMGSGNHPRSTAGFPPKGGWFDSEGRKVLVKWMACAPDEVPYWRSRANFYGVIQVNNVQKFSGPKDGEVIWMAYDNPQAVVRFHDAYSGKLVYAEGISLAESKRRP